MDKTMHFMVYVFYYTFLSIILTQKWLKMWCKRKEVQKKEEIFNIFFRGAWRVFIG